MLLMFVTKQLVQQQLTTSKYRCLRIRKSEINDLFIVTQNIVSNWND